MLCKEVIITGSHGRFKSKLRLSAEPDEVSLVDGIIILSTKVGTCVMNKFYSGMISNIN